MKNNVLYLLIFLFYGIAGTAFPQPTVFTHPDKIIHLPPADSSSCFDIPVMSDAYIVNTFVAGKINNDIYDDLVIFAPGGRNPLGNIFAGHPTEYINMTDTLYKFVDSDGSYGYSVRNIIPADCDGNGEPEFYGYSEMYPFKGAIFVYENNPQLTLTASANPVCQGDTVTYTAHGYGALPSGTLQWYVNGVPVSSGNINSGLVAYYPFNGNANDMSGNGNNAVQVSATLTADRHGNPNSAYNFAGLSNPQIIRVPNSSTLQFGNQASFSLWVRMNSYFGMDGWGNATPNGVHMLFSKDFDQCCLYEAIGGQADGNFSSGGCTNGWYSGINFGDTIPGSSIGQWMNMTYVFTPTEGRMYANGQLIASKAGITSFANSNSKELYFGRLNSFWYPLNGKLDDVRFYNRALTPGEVMQLYLGFDSTFSYVPQNGDVVYCVYQSSGTPVVVDTTNFITMTVNPRPVPTITGPASVCLTSQGQVYTTEPGKSAYAWSVSPGGTITSGGTSSSNTVTVMWQSQGQKWVKVNYANSFGCQAAAPVQLNVSVHPLPADLGQSTVLSPDLQNGLFAYYPLDGNANDLSGNNRNGIATNVNFVPGHTAQCASFLGTGNSFVNLGTWNLPDTFSISLFINRAVYTYPVYNPQQIIAKFDDITGNYRSFYLDLPDPSCFPRTAISPNGSPLYLADGTTNLQADQWYHIVATYNGSNLSRIFLNSLPEAENNSVPSSGVFNSNTPVYLGRDQDDWGPINNQYFGKIDEVRLYNRVLTQCEIDYLHTGNFSCDVLSADVSSDSICTGASTSLNINHSQSGVSYRLYSGLLPVGLPVMGTGTTISFNTGILAQTSSFTIHATNATTGCFITLDSAFTVQVSPLTIMVSPNTAICSGNNTTLTASGGTNYLWSNGMTTPSITVSPLVTTTYYVTVSNTIGCWDTDSVKVTVNPSPVPTISGPAALCFGTNNAVYTTQPGMSNYAWTVSAGGTITAGAGTGSITVTWNTLGTQTVSVNYTNASGCSALTPVSMSVTVNPMAAPTISGSSSMCVNSGYYTYSTETGMNNYQWSASPGATIIYGNGTPDLIVTWNLPGAQWLKVNYANSNGCTAVIPAQLNVMVNPLPGMAGPVTGSATVCAGAAGVNYSTSLIPDAVTYVWSLPPGASIASGAGTSSIFVDFAPNALPGNVAVYGNNLCGNGNLSQPFHVNVGALPGLAGVPVGESVVCEGDTGVIYYVSPILNASSYVWQILGGGIITAGNGTNSVRAKFPTGPASCDITVFGANSCGAGLISPVKTVTVNPLPPVPVISQSGDILASSAPTGNQWYFNGILIAGATQQTLLPDKSGLYSVMVSLLGCSSDMSEEHYYIVTGMNPPARLQISVFPVPSDGMFRVELSGSIVGEIRLSVMNGLGERVFYHHEVITNGGFSQTIDLRTSPPGLFTLLIENQTGRWVRKVVVTR